MTAKWYHNARIGVFYHWGIENEKTVGDFEKLTDGWDAKAWVAAAKKLHAKYVTLATFHNNFSYIVSWKSDVPGVQKTKRDFLGELIEAAEKEGIKVVVYITSAPVGQLESSLKNKCVDTDEYSRVRGVDINPYSYIDHQSIIAKELILELMDNYPEVGGFWFDGWNDHKVCEDVFRAVHEKNPNVINIRNNFYKEPYCDEDVMAQECLGKIYDPAYDMTSASWLEYSAPSEWCYVPFGVWDTVGTNTPRPCDIKFEIKRLTSILTAGWVAKIGLASSIDGKFLPYMDEYYDRMDEYLNWAGEALLEAKQGGFIGGSLNDGAYAFTTQNVEADTYYVAVTDAPIHGGTLKLINNGFEVNSVTNMKTGEAVKFNCNGGYLNITPKTWGEVARYGVMIFKIKAKAARKLELSVDDGQDLPHSIIINTNGGSYYGMELVEPNTSSKTFGAWGGQSPERMKDYVLYNNETGEKLSEGSFINQRDKKWVSLDGITANQLRLEIVNGYDTVEKSFATSWRGGWKTPIDDVTSITADRDGTVRFTDSENRLWEHNGIGKAYIADNIKKVICGADNSFYYLDTEDTIVGTDIKATDFGVTSKGEIYYIDCEARLHSPSGEIIAENVRDVCVAADDTVFIAADGVYKYKDGQLVEFKMPYNAVKIAAKGDFRGNGNIMILTPTGKIHDINNMGDNSFIAGYNGVDLSVGTDGVIQCIIGVSKGKNRVKKINLIEKGM